MGASFLARLPSPTAMLSKCSSLPKAVVLMIFIFRTSGPQGKVVPLTIISDPANWKAADLRGHEAEYTYTFTESDISELQAAVAKLEARGITDGRQIQQVCCFL